MRPLLIPESEEPEALDLSGDSKGLDIEARRIRTTHLVASGILECIQTLSVSNQVRAEGLLKCLPASPRSSVNL